MPNQTAILKISTALSNKPYFVKIESPDLSIDTIFQEAVSSLSNTGRPLESQQLENLYQQHQLFNNGKVVSKGDLFKELEFKTQQVGDQTVHVAEINLVTSHSGGILLCPNCHGHTTISKPPWIAGDQETWMAANVSDLYPCPTCQGKGYIQAEGSP